MARIFGTRGPVVPEVEDLTVEPGEGNAVVLKWEKPGGLFGAKFQPQKYLQNGFNTPSGKFEMYSTFLEEHGQDPIPVFREPAESPVGSPDLAESYSLILITGAKNRYYTHSQGRNIPSLRKHLPEAVAELNPATANELGVTQGEMVVVSSPRGSIKLKANLTEDVEPRVVSIIHGWSEANVNRLTGDDARDPISGFPHLTAGLCNVAKAS